MRVVRLDLLIFLILLQVFPSCTSPKKSLGDNGMSFIDRRPLKLGMTRNSVLSLFPEAQAGSFQDFFDLRILRFRTDIIYLGFDSLNHLEFFTDLYKPLSVDSSFKTSQDYRKYFTFSARLRGWKAYWTMQQNEQLFQAFSPDSEMINMQTPSSLLNPKRRNISFRPPEDTVQLFVPNW